MFILKEIDVILRIKISFLSKTFQKHKNKIKIKMFHFHSVIQNIVI